MFGWALAGCQPAANGNGPGGHPALALRILLPAALTRDRARYSRFQSRVSRMELDLESDGGATFQTAVGPGEWNTVVLPELDFPRGDTDRLRVRVRVWDRTAEGMPRSYPALKGKVVVRSEDLAGDAVNTIPIRLSLAVSAAEY